MAAHDRFEEVASHPGVAHRRDLRADRRLVGAPTLLEASAVLLARKGRQGVIALDALLSRLAVVVVPMSPQGAGLRPNRHRSRPD